jgi:putative ABC transport system permease protein
VILTLALGIGANSAVFSAIYAVLLRPLPFPRGDELVKLAQTGARVDQPFVAPARLEDWNGLNSTLSGVTGYYSQDSSELSGPLPEKLKWALVAPRFLRVLGAAPALGRDFSPQEEHFGGPAAVLISDRLWRRRFGASPDAIGKALRIGSSAMPIIGVMPATFRFPDRDVDLWGISAPDAPYSQSRESTWFTVIARLKPGVKIEQARADLARVQNNLGRQFPKTDAKIAVAIEPLKEATVGGVRKSLWVLFGSVSLLLLIACTNIAALLVSRAAGRQHEISVRYSLGASRASVAAQLMTEVLLLATAGALLGDRKSVV